MRLGFLYSKLSVKVQAPILKGSRRLAVATLASTASGKERGVCLSEERVVSERALATGSISARVPACWRLGNPPLPVFVRHAGAMDWMVGISIV